jgi:glutaminase
MTQSIVSPIETFLADLHNRYAALDDGAVATYIPELAKADPRWFGIAIATTDGHVYQVGDAAQPFTIQSISKPFAYGVALEDRGRAAVLAKVGVEPSGDAFNSISLAPQTGRPLNPMINAGAIATTALVRGASSAEKRDRLVEALSMFAGRPLAINDAVYQSERATGHRNRAIGHMLRNFDILTEDPTGPLDVYFQQCSIEVTCRDLAVMAVTLANGGVNPITGERAIRRDFVDSVLSVMMSCGMYDFAGEWLYSVGIPAKSGVAGGILAVLPGQIGIGVFSPLLDARGNSVRGINVCRDLSTSLDLHSLRAPRPGRGAIRASYSLAEVRSRRARPEWARRVLDETGRRARVWELQGDLMFAAAEAAVRKIVEASGSLDAVVLDFRRTTQVDPTAAKLLTDLFRQLRACGKPVFLAELERHRELARLVAETVGPADDGAGAAVLTSLDRAIERAEELLLASTESGRAPPASVPLEANDLLRGLSAADVAVVRERLKLRQFRRGEIIVHEGERSDELFLVGQGEVSIVLELPGGQARRLATVSAGMMFGELAVFRGTPRTADVRADTAVECFVLTKAELDRLGRDYPAIRMALLEAMLGKVANLAAALTKEIAALEA